ncbi:MAG TPA: AAA family ATPase [Armatimonadota bacterium]|nr:AAA family ATPase [Armatimonadota bacterium]
MLTRLKVNGFKNLVDLDVRFGPFTCVAGANGVGKSNLFDAIHFLSALSDRPLLDAAFAVRSEGGGVGDTRSLFHRHSQEHDEEMTFEVEMIVPDTGVDDLGQPAEASITFLRYAVTIGYRGADGQAAAGPLELRSESLEQINKGDARDHLLFSPKPVWRSTAVRGARRGAAFISTEAGAIKLHQDKSSGRPYSRPAARMPRTVVSATNAAEGPTVVLARREMQSWRLLQLEPSALRQPDELTAPARLGADGSHLPALLYELARSSGASVYARIANRLSELIDDVRDVCVERDDRRELLTLNVTGRDGTVYPARALSDGTLRFLALSALEEDVSAEGLLCLEEPENGIHPARIPAMLRLLQDIATDTEYATGPDNPLRQVIVNTHAPAVVMQAPDDSLLVADLRETIREGRRFQRVSFGCLPDTWRAKSADPGAIVSRGQLLAYLNPVVRQPSNSDSIGSESNGAAPGHRRVVDRQDLQPLLPLFDSAR